MSDRPQAIGPYRILAELGRGGMSVVYRGTHLVSGDIVAVKTVLLPREGLLNSIRREIHALARIRHPGVVRILDEGLHDGIPWYAMELLEGRSLRQYCEETLQVSAAEVASGRPAAAPEPPKTEPATEAPAVSSSRLSQILTLVYKLCAALAYLHGEGIVHRDLKPDNILIVTTSGDAKVPGGPPGSPLPAPTGSGSATSAAPVILDFGLASRFTADVSREALQLDTVSSGTFGYMAPEQLMGELVDARADLYALGCMLYEVLTGWLPRTPAVRLHGSGSEDWTPELVPPSALTRGVPPELDALILRLLARDPRQRLGHADDVAAVLMKLGAGDGAIASWPRPRAYLYRPEFTGRAEMIASLDQRLARVATGQGSAVLLGGQSGVGKTRLALELARRARARDLLVLSGECQPLSAGTGAQEGSGGAPLHALRASLQAIGDRCRERGADQTTRLLGPRVKLLAAYEPSLAALPGQDQWPEPAELPAQAARLRVFDSLADTYEALAADQPVLLILDDLQWADDLTLGLLRFLLQTGRLQRMRLLLVGLYRTEEASADLRALFQLIDSGSVELGLLDEAAVGSIVADMLALDRPPANLVSYIGRQSNGNPFFVAEYLRAAVAEGVLYRGSGGLWQVAEESEEVATENVYESLPLPRSLQDLVGRRLERLSTGARQLVEAAAVLGREIDEGTLAHVANLGSVEEMEGLEEVLARQVMEATLFGAVRFVHDKTREVAYGLLSDARRRELHRSAAVALEQLPRIRRDENLAALGHHWQQAGEAAAACRWYLIAARSAAAHYAQVEAERLYRAYLSLLNEPNAEAIRARNDLARVLHQQGRNEEAAAEHEHAIEESRRQHERALEGESLRWLVWIRFVTGQIEQARALCEEALAIAREVGDRPGEGKAMRNLADVFNRQGRPEARDFYVQALTILRQAGDMRELGIAVLNFGALEHIRGHLDEARRLYESSLPILQRVGDRGSESTALANLAELYSDQGLVQQARACFQQAESTARETGYRRYEGASLLFQATLERRAGRLAEAERLLARAEIIFRDIGDPMRLASSRCERGHLALARGGSAAEQLRDAHQLSTRLQVRPESDLGSALSRLERAQGAFEAGWQERLFRGELCSDIPEGIRRWIEQNDAAQLASRKPSSSSPPSVL